MISPYEKVIEDVAAHTFPYGDWVSTGGQPYLTSIIVASGTAPSGTVLIEGSPGNFDTNNVLQGANSNIVYTIATVTYSSGTTYNSTNQVHPFVRHRISGITNSVGASSANTATPSGLITTYLFAAGNPDRL